MTKPKERSPSMQFYFRQFMADDAVILMDLDAVGAHILLMCFAGSSPEGFRIQNRDEILRKILRGVGASDWDRIKPQIMAAWDISDDGQWIIQRGMQRTLLKQKNFSKTQSERAKERWKGCQTGTERDAKRVPKTCSSSSSSSSSSSANNNNNITKSNIIIPSPKARNVTPKIQHGEFVFLTEAEHQKLLSQFDASFVQACIDKLNAWIGSEPTPKRKTNGKNAAYCFRSWVISAIQKEQATGKTSNGYKPHTAASTVEHNLEYFRRTQNEPIDLERIANAFSCDEEEFDYESPDRASLVSSARKLIG